MIRFVSLLLAAAVLGAVIFLGYSQWGVLTGLGWFVNDLAVRMKTDRSLVVCILSFLAIFGGWILLCAIRWAYRFVLAILGGGSSILGGMQEQAAAVETLEESLIIDSPGLKKPAARVIETVFSAAVWVFFMYLLQTIVTTIFWLLGMEHIYGYNVTKDSIDATLATMIFALLVAGAALIILIVWAQWNYWRYGRLERRRARPEVTDEETAQQFSVRLISVEQMRKAKIATILPVPSGIIFQEMRSRITME